MGLKSLLKTATRPLIVGHRGMGTSVKGGISEYIENSVESFLKAFEVGCDGVELDVFLTADKKLPVIHCSLEGDMSDNVQNMSGMIEDYSGDLSDLRLRLPENISHRVENAPSVPDLSQVLDALANKLKQGNSFVNVELKGNKRELSRHVLNLLTKYNIPFLVSSFNYKISDLTDYYNLYTPPGDLIADFVNNEHGIELGLLFDQFGGFVAKAEFFLTILSKYNASWLILSDNTDVLCPATNRCVKVTSGEGKEFIELLHSKGYYVGIYFSLNEDDEDIIKGCHASGLDMLIVNEPIKAIEIKNKLNIK